jgi:hypothetical protein
MFKMISEKSGLPANPVFKDLADGCSRGTIESVLEVYNKLSRINFQIFQPPATAGANLTEGPKWE